MCFFSPCTDVCDVSLLVMALQALFPLAIVQEALLLLDTSFLEGKIPPAPDEIELSDWLGELNNV